MYLLTIFVFKTSYAIYRSKLDCEEIYFLNVVNKIEIKIYQKASGYTVGQSVHWMNYFF